MAIVLGGGTRQGLWSDAAVQLASLALIIVLAFRSPHPLRLTEDRFAFVLVVVLLLLPLSQLIRLPPELWTALPGRGSIALTYQDAAIALPWLPISLDPLATWNTWLALLPAVAVFFATLQLDLNARRSLSLLIIALGIVSVLFGLAQLMQGPASSLRLYPFTNPGDSVGFFANRNHYAALLTSLVPITAAWMIGLANDRKSGQHYGILICLIVFAILILGLGMARSRAGIIFAILAAIASFALAANNEARGKRRGFWAIGAAAAIGVILVVHFAFFRILGRFETDVLADLRFTIAEVTGSAVWTYLPIGSGFGTFEAIYRIFEPVEALLPAYVNHAHNDWLETLLEGGIAAAILLVAWIAWLAIRSLGVWRSKNEHVGRLDRVLAQSATITITLLLFHSFVDYPLRTTTLSVLLAWSAALLIKPASPSEADEKTEQESRSAVHTPHRRRTRRRHDNIRN